MTAITPTTSLGALMDARKRGEAMMRKLAGAAVEFRGDAPTVSAGPAPVHFKFWSDEPGCVAIKMLDGAETLTADDCATLSGMFDALARRLLAETTPVAANPVEQPGAIDIPARPMPVEERATPFSRPEGNEF